MEQWMRAAENSATEITNAFLNVTDTSGLIYNISLLPLFPP